MEILETDGREDLSGADLRGKGKQPKRQVREKSRIF
jgi:hypothetical protein